MDFCGHSINPEMANETPHHDADVIDPCWSGPSLAVEVAGAGCRHRLATFGRGGSGRKGGESRFER